MHNDKALHQVLNQAKQNLDENKPCLAVFDLDSTLFDVGPRLKRILVEISSSKEFRLKYPEELQYFTSMTIHSNDWGLADVLSRKLGQQPSPQFITAVKDFWRKRFFSNESLEYDIPVVGSIHFVNQLYKLNVQIAYLTGRDIARMGEGSARILKKWGFPVSDNAQLVLKPQKGMEDHLFKTNWFHEQASKNYNNIWFFENEPVNINDLLLNRTDVEVIYFHSTHSRKETPPTHLQTVQHFLLTKV